MYKLPDSMILLLCCSMIKTKKYDSGSQLQHEIQKGVCQNDELSERTHEPTNSVSEFIVEIR